MSCEQTQCTHVQMLTSEMQTNNVKNPCKQATENKELSKFKLIQVVLTEVYMKKHVLRMGIVEYTREQRSILEKNGRYLKTSEYTPKNRNKVHPRNNRVHLKTI